MGGLKRILKSSKVLIGIASVLAAFAVNYLDMDKEVAMDLSLKIVGAGIALIVAIAYEDGQAKKNGNGGPNGNGGAT